MDTQAAAQPAPGTGNGSDGGQGAAVPAPGPANGATVSVEGHGETNTQALAAPAAGQQAAVAQAAADLLAGEFRGEISDFQAKVLALFTEQREREDALKRQLALANATASFAARLEALGSMITDSNATRRMSPEKELLHLVKESLMLLGGKGRATGGDKEAMSRR